MLKTPEFYPEPSPGLPAYNNPSKLFANLTGQEEAELPIRIYDFDFAAAFLQPAIAVLLAPRGSSLAASHENFRRFRILNLLHQGVTGMREIKVALTGKSFEANSIQLKVDAISEDAESCIPELHKIPGYSPRELGQYLCSYADGEDVSIHFSPFGNRAARYARASRLADTPSKLQQGRFAEFMGIALELAPNDQLVSDLTQMMLTTTQPEPSADIKNGLAAIRAIVDNAAATATPNFKDQEFNTTLKLSSDDQEVLFTVLDYSSTGTGFAALAEAHPFQDDYVLRQSVIKSLRKAIVIPTIDDPGVRLRGAGIMPGANVKTFDQ